MHNCNLGMYDYYASRHSRTRNALKVSRTLCVCVRPSVPAVTAQRLQCAETNSFYRFPVTFSWVLFVDLQLKLCSRVWLLLYIQ